MVNFEGEKYKELCDTGKCIELTDKLEKLDEEIDFHLEMLKTSRKRIETEFNMVSARLEII